MYETFKDPSSPVSEEKMQGIEKIVHLLVPFCGRIVKHGENSSNTKHEKPKLHIEALITQDFAVLRKALGLRTVYWIMRHHALSSQNTKITSFFFLSQTSEQDVLIFCFTY